MSEPLRAEHTVAFSYRRSVGGATETFLRGLAQRKIVGSRTPDGTVVIPPTEYDAEEFIRVGDSGVVISWTWVVDPRPEHPLPHPFAFALIRLDGADTALLHAVDIGDERAMRCGMRVYADWRAHRTGSITDIRAFVPHPPPSAPDQGEAPESIEVVTDVHLHYVYEPGQVLSGFLHGLGERRIRGGQCVVCGKVYVPPRLRCPACGTGPMTRVAMPDRGRVVTYTVVHVPPPGNRTEVPFAWASVRLDGADVAFPHLLGEVALDEIRVGMPLEAVWVSDDELAPTWASIRYFRPVAE